MPKASPKEPTLVEYLVTDIAPDLDNDELADRLNAFADQGWRVMFLTGRSDSVRKAWLEREK